MLSYPREPTEVELVIRARRSTRTYRQDPVPRELIERVLESACWAPSALNRQPWHFVVVTDVDRRAALARASGFAGLVVQRHVSRAPVLIALCGDAHLSSWYVHDCCLASQNLMLAATALGLGTCWIGAFSEEKARGVLALPAEIRIVGIITMGYPVRAHTPPTPRLPLHDVVHWESFDMRGGHGPGPRSVGKSGLLSLWRAALDLVGLGHR